jgi:hypothetical protein
VSGLNQQFAKLSYWKRYRGFESPLLRQRNEPDKVGLFLFIWVRKSLFFHTPYKIKIRTLVCPISLISLSTQGSRSNPIYLAPAGLLKIHIPYPGLCPWLINYIPSGEIFSSLKTSDNPSKILLLCYSKSTKFVRISIPQFYVNSAICISSCYIFFDLMWR